MTLSLAELRKRGYICGITEKWNHFAKIRQDLFGFCDILSIKPPNSILAVQTTSTANISTRIKKIAQEPNAHVFLASGGQIAVHGWSKRGERGKRKVWELKEVPITELENAVK